MVAAPVHLLDRLTGRKRVLLHAGYWLFILVLYAILFGEGSRNFLQTLFFVGLLLPVTIGSTYLLNYYLVPAYLLKERYGLFVLYFIYTLVGALFLEMWVVVITFIVVAKVDIKGMNPSSINVPFLMAALLMVVFFGMAIKMLSHWRKSREDYQILLREKVEAELRFLKMQLNPHFLFNTLNNLYFLTSEKSDMAPKAILALSELLDYVINETRVDYIQLDKEIRLINNYIELEKLRYADRLTVKFEIQGDPASHRIAPMLMLTLVENAFKHGAGKSTGKHWIHMDMECTGQSIRLQVSNSHGGNKGNNGSGVGLVNFRQQLKLLYPGRHSVEILETEEMFTVKAELS